MPKIYKCDKCNKYFNKKDHLITHINRKFPCVNPNNLSCYTIKDAVEISEELPSYFNDIKTEKLPLKTPKTDLTFIQKNTENAEEIPKNALNITENTLNITENAEESQIPKNAEESQIITENAEEIPKNALNITENAEEIPKNAEEIPKNALNITDIAEKVTEKIPILENKNDFTIGDLKVNNNVDNLEHNETLKTELETELETGLETGLNTEIETGLKTELNTELKETNPKIKKGFFSKKTVCQLQTKMNNNKKDITITDTPFILDNICDITPPAPILKQLDTKKIYINDETDNITFNEFTKANMYLTDLSNIQKYGKRKSVKNYKSLHNLTPQTRYRKLKQKTKEPLNVTSTRPKTKKRNIIITKTL